MNGARGRTRTGTVLPPRDFHTRYGFRRRAGWRLWGLDFIFAMAPWRGRQEPSSLYTFPDGRRPGLARGGLRHDALRFPRI